MVIFGLLRSVSWEKILEKLMFDKRSVSKIYDFPGGSAVKYLPMQETWVGFLGLEDLLEKEMATHSSILAWRIPLTEEPGGLQSMELQKGQTKLSD